MTEDEKRASLSLGYALTLDDSAASNGLMLILAARCLSVQRAGLAYASLSSLPDDHAYRVASLVLYGVYNGEVAA